jgi:hypothetical protein
MRIDDRRPSSFLAFGDASDPIAHKCVLGRVTRLKLSLTDWRAAIGTPPRVSFLRAFAAPPVVSRASSPVGSVRVFDWLSWSLGEVVYLSTCCLLLRSSETKGRQEREPQLAKRKLCFARSPSGNFSGFRYTIRNSELRKMVQMGLGRVRHSPLAFFAQYPYLSQSSPSCRLVLICG